MRKAIVTLKMAGFSEEKSHEILDRFRASSLKESVTVLPSRRS